MRRPNCAVYRFVYSRVDVSWRMGAYWLRVALRAKPASDE
jgi:hypothetical protein